MPANVQTYVGRHAAWHKLGTVTGKYQTWAEILAHGGLDFDVFILIRFLGGLGRLSWGRLRDFPPLSGSIESVLSDGGLEDGRFTNGLL